MRFRALLGNILGYGLIICVVIGIISAIFNKGITILKYLGLAIIGIPIYIIGGLIDFFSKIKVRYWYIRAFIRVNVLGKNASIEYGECERKIAEREKNIADKKKKAEEEREAVKEGKKVVIEKKRTFEESLNIILAEELKKTDWQRRKEDIIRCSCLVGIVLAIVGLIWLFQNI